MYLFSRQPKNERSTNLGAIMKNTFRTVVGALIMLVAWSPVLQAQQALPTLSIQPANTLATQGNGFSLDVSITDVTDLFAYQFDIAFDPAVLEAQSTTEGSLLPTGGSTFFIPGTIDNTKGLISFTADSLIGAISGVNGTGVLAQLEFSAIGAGTSPVNLSNVILQDSALLDISANIIGGAVQIQGGTVPEPASIPLSD